MIKPTKRESEGNDISQLTIMDNKTNLDTSTIGMLKRFDTEYEYTNSKLLMGRSISGD